MAVVGRCYHNSLEWVKSSGAEPERAPVGAASAILPSLPAAFSDLGSVFTRLPSAIPPSALPSRSPQRSRLPYHPPSPPAPLPAPFSDSAFRPSFSFPSVIPPLFPAPALPALLPLALPHLPPFPSRSYQRSRLPPRPPPAVFYDFRVFSRLL